MVSKALVALRKLLEPPRDQVTQSSLAKRLGVSQQAVSLWLKGETVPSAETLARIEDATGIPMRAWTEPSDENAAQGAA